MEHTRGGGCERAGSCNARVGDECNRIPEARLGAHLVRLEADRRTTNMTVTIRCASAEHLEQFVKLGADVGTDRTFDNLVEYVANKR